MPSIRDIVRGILKERGMFFRFGLRQTKYGTIVNLYPEEDMDISVKIIIKEDIKTRCRQNGFRINKVEYP